MTTASSVAPAMPSAIARLLLLPATESPTADMAEAAIAAVLEDASEVDIAALLTGLHHRPATADLLAGAARALRSRAVRITPASGDLLDTCGTGGTGLSTFNISTTTAIVAAACGVKVAKHGNRGATSKSGSADVLEALGVGLDVPPDRVAACIDEVGIGFLYARALHPAMMAVAGVRGRLPFRTVFNQIGPLSNPAGATRQLLGSGSLAQAQLLAGAAHQLGTERTVVVCGDDRLDEVTLAGPTTYQDVTAEGIITGQWTPDDFGLAPVPLDALRVDTPAASAALVRSILAGKPSPQADIVLANAAVALWTVGRVDAVADGVAMARNAITSGEAAATLGKLAAFTTTP